MTFVLTEWQFYSLKSHFCHLWHNICNAKECMANKRKKINQGTVAELWWRAAGRCEFNGCQKPLYKHGITMQDCNISNIVHIIAVSSDGARGESDLTPDERNDISNLMLMCPDCHRLIDHEGKLQYTVKQLRDMKSHHEQRMEMLTGLKEDKQARIVTFGSKIGDAEPYFNEATLHDALLPEFYPSPDGIIDLGGNWYTPDNGWEEFWKEEEKSIDFVCKNKILTTLPHWKNKRIALFALAPMPSLVKLGTILNNKNDVKVFQLMRGPVSWKWRNDDDVEYIIKRPEITSGIPVLVFSLSFPIGGRIKERFGDSGSVWEFTIPSPSTNFLTSKRMLYKFCSEVEQLLDEIRRQTNKDELHVFMAMPVACAVELGRTWMQKPNMTLLLYDYDTRYSKEDQLAITIKNKNI